MRHHLADRYPWAETIRGLEQNAACCGLGRTSVLLMARKLYQKHYSLAKPGVLYS
jgi:hypothetical protein